MWRKRLIDGTEEVNYKSHGGTAESQERNIHYEESHKVKPL